jgi:hypothetical protein
MSGTCAKLSRKNANRLTKPAEPQLAEFAKQPSKVLAPIDGF